MRQRRRRTTFTEEQLDRLEECFREEKFPGIIIREALAQQLNIKEDRVQVKQFGNYRSRQNKLGQENECVNLYLWRSIRDCTSIRQNF